MKRTTSQAEVLLATGQALAALVTTSAVSVGIASAVIPFIVGTISAVIVG